MAGFLLGAAGMFAVTYSTQAILPQLGRTFHVTPAEAGLTISVVVLGARGRRVDLGAAFRPLRPQALDRARERAPRRADDRRRPGAELRAVTRVSGASGSLHAGAPDRRSALHHGGIHTAHRWARDGNYVTALIAGGLIGRVGVALLAAAVGWRWAIGLLAVLPLAAAVVMHRSLVDLPLAPAEGSRYSGVRRQLRNRRLLQTRRRAARSSSPSSGPSRTSSSAWSGRRSRRAGRRQRRLRALAARCLWPSLRHARRPDRLAAPRGQRDCRRRRGLALTLPVRLPTLVLSLALVTLANWAGVTAAQIGVAAATNVDRGTASALYYSLYYFTGALGGYLPGLAWQRFHWGGVVATGWIALALAAAALALGGRR